MVFTEAQRLYEERLLREASSLGELLERLPSRFSPVLTGVREWQQLLERARGLPLTMAVFPFGFELPLHNLRPGVDLGGMIMGGSRSGAFFEEAGRAEGADISTRAAARLLAETGKEDSALRRIAGRSIVLEYDVASAPGGSAAIFLGPGSHTQGGDLSGERSRDLRTVAAAIAAAAGGGLDDREGREIERVYEATIPDTRVTSVGRFPSRGGGTRLAVTGFQQPRDVLAFLERAGWEGKRSVAGDVMAHLQDGGAFTYMALHLHMDADGVGPALGLSFFAQDRPWTPGIAPWTSMLDRLRALGLVNSEKLSALAASLSEAKLMLGQSGAYACHGVIHHIKLVLQESRIEQVKAYYFFIVVPRL